MTEKDYVSSLMIQKYEEQLDKLIKDEVETKFKDKKEEEQNGNLIEETKHLLKEAIAISINKYREVMNQNIQKPDFYNVFLGYSDTSDILSNRYFSLYYRKLSDIIDEKIYLELSPEETQIHEKQNELKNQLQILRTEHETLSDMLDTYALMDEEEFEALDIDLYEHEEEILQTEYEISKVEKELLNYHVDYLFEKKFEYKYPQLQKLNLDDINNFVKNYIPKDIKALRRYFEVEGYEQSEEKINNLAQGNIEFNQIYNVGYEELHEGMALDNNVVDVVLTDPPYYIGIANWDKRTTMEKRYDEFYKYLESLVPILHEESIVMIFNDYSNVDMIQNIFEDIHQSIFNEESYTSYSKKLFNFTVIGYVEWTKSNSAALKAKRDNKSKLGSYQNSEYLIIAINNIDTNPRGVKFLNLVKESREIYASVNKDSTIRDKDGRIHTTTKKASVIEEIIQRFTEPEDKVLDSYSGSGAISMSLMENGRQFIGSEIDRYMYQLSTARLNSVKGLIGIRPFPLNISEPFNFENSYIYLKFKDLIEENYTNYINALDIEERITYVRNSLIDIAQKFGKQNIKIKELSEDEISFIIGFYNHYMNSIEFHKYYGASRLNPDGLFDLFSDYKKVNQLRKVKNELILTEKVHFNKKDYSYYELLEVYNSEELTTKEHDSLNKTLNEYLTKINKKESQISEEIENLRGEGKFIIDKVVRFYNNYLSDFNIDIEEAISLYKNGYRAFANYKNKTIEEKEDARIRYIDYLNKLIKTLLLYEDKAQKLIAKRESVSNNKLNQARYYYKILTKVSGYLLYLLAITSYKADENMVLLRKLLSKYVNLTKDDIRVLLIEKLHLNNTDEIPHGLNKTVEMAIQNGLEDLTILLKSPFVIEEFEYSNIFHKTKSILSSDNILGILDYATFTKLTEKKDKNGKTKLTKNGEIEYKKDVIKFSTLTPTQLKNSLNYQFDEKYSNLFIEKLKEPNSIPFKKVKALYLKGIKTTDEVVKILKDVKKATVYKHIELIKKLDEAKLLTIDDDKNGNVLQVQTETK